MEEDEHIRQFQCLLGYSTTALSLGIAHNSVWIKASSIAVITDVTGHGTQAGLLFTDAGASFAFSCNDLNEVIQWWKTNATVGLITAA